MFDFAWEGTHYGDTSDQYDANTYQSLEYQWHDLGLSARALGSTDARSLSVDAPERFTDERLLAFDASDLEQGWAPAQAAQAVSAVFAEMFAQGNNLKEVADLAAQWAQELEGAGLPLDVHQSLFESLCGVNNAALQAIDAGEPLARWFEGRTGTTCTPAPKPAPAPAKAGRWYSARCFDGTKWKCRRLGERVELVSLDESKRYDLSPEQAAFFFKRGDLLPEEEQARG